MDDHATDPEPPAGGTRSVDPGKQGPPFSAEKQSAGSPAADAAVGGASLILATAIVADAAETGDGARPAFRVFDINGVTGNSAPVHHGGNTYLLGISRQSHEGVTTVTIGTGNPSDNSTVRLPDALVRDVTISIRDSGTPDKIAEIVVSASQPIIDVAGSPAFSMKLDTPFGPPSPQPPGARRDAPHDAPPYQHHPDQGHSLKPAPGPAPSPPTTTTTPRDQVPVTAGVPGPTAVPVSANSAGKSYEAFAHVALKAEAKVKETVNKAEQKLFSWMERTLTAHRIDPTRPQDIVYATPRQQFGVVKDLINNLRVAEASLGPSAAGLPAIDEPPRYEIHFAKDLLEKAFHNLTDPASTPIQRAEAVRHLPDMIAAAMIEQGFVKPLLDAPAETIEAGQLIARMVDHVRLGRPDLAMQDAAAANARVTDVAGAILSEVFSVSHGRA